MKALEKMLETVSLSLGYVILFALLVCISDTVRAAKCFPNCQIKRNEAPQPQPQQPDKDLKDELKWLCRESGKKDC